MVIVPGLQEIIHADGILSSTSIATIVITQGESNQVDPFSFAVIIRTVIIRTVIIRTIVFFILQLALGSIFFCGFISFFGSLFLVPIISIFICVICLTIGIFFCVSILLLGYICFPFFIRFLVLIILPVFIVIDTAIFVCGTPFKFNEHVTQNYFIFFQMTRTLFNASFEEQLFSSWGICREFGIRVNERSFRSCARQESKSKQNNLHGGGLWYDSFYTKLKFFFFL
mmetsp:Transcript_12929/g.16933  ORF Transcript_12929/g.16933 Transcript_12929/m.16933 type:complete len:227 (+) Transcript_12929:339-1019(+)